MIVVVGGIKGGSGKTTICTNLTVLRSTQGRRVLLVDADEQRSASDWEEHRESLGIKSSWTTIQLTGKNVYTQVQKMRKDYDDILIDTGGRDTTSQRSAMGIADVFLAPFQPRSLDVWTMGKVSSLLTEIRTFNAKLKAYAIINRADPFGSDNKDAADIIIESEGINFIPINIGSRKSFANAASEGLGVTELKKKDKVAIEEIKMLSNFIFNIKIKSK